MKRLKPIILIAMSIILTGCFALEQPDESTGAVSAPTLEVATAEVVEVVTSTEQPAPTPTAVETSNEADVVEEVVADEVAKEASAVNTDEAPASETAEIAPAAPVVYTIDAAQSEARFIIEEVLRGTDTTVVGVTSNLAGQVSVNFANPAITEVGAIVINARDIVTDSEFRNRAISNRILLTDQYELITFTPTSINRLPESVTPGESYSFDVVGELTITDQTREVTFATTVTPDSVTQLRGLASAEILYADFNLEIPFSQSVDAVEDSVILELAFVALADDSAAVVDVETSSDVSIESATEAVSSKLNLNNVSADELQATIPSFSQRMTREFAEYAPYVSIQAFRQEIGKYVDEETVAGYEAYIYVPININASDAATLAQIPGVDEAMAETLIAARPYDSAETFLAEMAALAPTADVAVAAGLLE